MDSLFNGNHHTDTSDFLSLLNYSNSTLTPNKGRTTSNNSRRQHQISAAFQAEEEEEDEEAGVKQGNYENSISPEGVKITNLTTAKLVVEPEVDHGLNPEVKERGEFDDVFVGAFGSSLQPEISINNEENGKVLQESHDPPPVTSSSTSGGGGGGGGVFGEEREFQQIQLEFADLLLTKNNNNNNDVTGGGRIDDVGSNVVSSGLFNRFPYESDHHHHQLPSTASFASSDEKEVLKVMNPNVENSKIEQGITPIKGLMANEQMLTFKSSSEGREIDNNELLFLNRDLSSVPFSPSTTLTIINGNNQQQQQQQQQQKQQQQKQQQQQQQKQQKQQEEEGRRHRHSQLHQVNVLFGRDDNLNRKSSSSSSAYVVENIHSRQSLPQEQQKLRYFDPQSQYVLFSSKKENPVCTMNENQYFIVTARDLMPTMEHIRLLKSFPGPLLTNLGVEQTDETIIARYIEDRVVSTSLRHPGMSRLWKLLSLFSSSKLYHVYCSQANDKIKETQLLQEQEQVEEMKLLEGIKNILQVKQLQQPEHDGQQQQQQQQRRRQRLEVGDNVTDDNQMDHQQQELLKLEWMLLEGRLEEACSYAADVGLWAHSLLLSSMIDRETYQRIAIRFAKASFQEGSPMHTLYSLFADKPEQCFPHTTLNPRNNSTSLITEITKEDQPEVDKLRLEEADGWKKNLVMLLSNRTSKCLQVLLKLADVLLSRCSNNSATDLLADVHFIWLCADFFFHFPTDGKSGATTTTKTTIANNNNNNNKNNNNGMVVANIIMEKALLVGSTLMMKQDIQSHTTGNDSITLEAIQRTEIYEYYKSKADPSFSIPKFQPFKLLYAHCLEEAGLLENAWQYCQNIKKSLYVSSPHVNLLSHPQKFLEDLQSLDKRLCNTLHKQPTISLSFESSSSSSSSSSSTTTTSTTSWLPTMLFRGTSPSSSTAAHSTLNQHSTNIGNGNSWLSWTKIDKTITQLIHGMSSDAAGDGQTDSSVTALDDQLSNQTKKLTEGQREFLDSIKKSPSSLSNDSQAPHSPQTHDEKIISTSQGMQMLSQRGNIMMETGSSTNSAVTKNTGGGGTNVMEASPENGGFWSWIIPSSLQRKNSSSNINFGKENPFYFDKKLGKWLRSGQHGTQTIQPSKPPPSLDDLLNPANNSNIFTTPLTAAAGSQQPTPNQIILEKTNYNTNTSNSPKQNKSTPLSASLQNQHFTTPVTGAYVDIFNSGKTSQPILLDDEDASFNKPLQSLTFSNGNNLFRPKSTTQTSTSNTSTIVDEKQPPSTPASRTKSLETLEVLDPFATVIPPSSSNKRNRQSSRPPPQW